MTHKRGCALHDRPGLLGSAMGVGVFCTCWLSINEPIQEVAQEEVLAPFSIAEVKIRSPLIPKRVDLYVLPDEGQHKDSRNRGPVPREYRVMVTTASATSTTDANFIFKDFDLWK